MRTKIWLNLDPGKVDVTYLYERFGKLDCDFTSEAAKEGDTSDVFAKAQQADIIIATMERYDKEMLSKLSGKVKLIHKYGTGLDTIDVAEATKMGIAVANVPGANAPAVAETAMMHILNVGRRFVPCVCGVKNGRWPSTITGTELDGKTIGLLGYGRIAKNLARMLSGFQVKILAYDPFVSEESSGRVEFTKCKEELFEKSDIVSLHIPCNNVTKKSINAELFNLMKKGSCIVNTCRGGVINEEDLVSALRSGQLAAAGLDVLTEEPPREDNELMKMENVYISSHMGAASLESEYRSQVIIADNIEKFLQGSIPDDIKNPECVQKRQ